MPRLLAFLPCERIIIDDEEKQTSLLSIVEGVTVNVEGDIPEDSIAPLNWAVFTLWRMNEGERGKEFEQLVVITSPSRRQIGESVIKFKIDTYNHRVKFKIRGLWIGEAGDWLVQLSLRAVGVDEWQHIADYPISVSHKGQGNERSRAETAEAE